MLNNASFTAGFTFPGDVLDHRVGESLHMDTVYADHLPVLCPCGCPASKSITILKDGDVVLIKNLPKVFQDEHVLSAEVRAVKVGGINEPAFRIKKAEKGTAPVTISYFDLRDSGDFHSVEFYVERICEEWQ